MTDGQEFLPTAKVTYEFDDLAYWITVNEYGAADVRCLDGRGEKWRVKVRPGKTFVDTIAFSTVAFDHKIDDSWVNRFDAAIKDLRGLVGA